jgi:hypothetical protein
MTPRTTRTEVTNLLDYLLESEIAIATNPVVESNGRIGWSVSSGGPFLVSRTPRLSNYRHWLATSAYSAVLADGSLLQLSYDFDGRLLTGHRLAHIPSPFDMDVGLLRTAPFADVFDIYAESPEEPVALRTPIRFDFNRNKAGPGHPAAHFTFNSSDCRIACLAPLRVGQFAAFVFASFYPTLYAAHTYLQSGSTHRFDDATVTASERQAPYVDWRT